jgi:hypothetical protein
MDDEMRVDFRENPGFFFGAFCFQLHLAGGDILTAFAEYHHDIELGASTHSYQQHLHRPQAQVATSGFRRPIHDNCMAAA